MRLKPRCLDLLVYVSRCRRTPNNHGTPAPPPQTPTIHASIQVSAHNKGVIGDGMVGLGNLGNTCYINSSVQCLSHTPLLTEYFLSSAYVNDVNVDNKLGLQVGGLAWLLLAVAAAVGGCGCGCSFGLGHTRLGCVLYILWYLCPRRCRKRQEDCAVSLWSRRA